VPADRRSRLARCALGVQSGRADSAVRRPDPLRPRGGAAHGRPLRV